MVPAPSWLGDPPSRPPAQVHPPQPQVPSAATSLVSLSMVLNPQLPGLDPSLPLRPQQLWSSVSQKIQALEEHGDHGGAGGRSKKGEKSGQRFSCSQKFTVTPKQCPLWAVEGRARAQQSFTGEDVVPHRVRLLPVPTGCMSLSSTPGLQTSPVTWEAGAPAVGRTGSGLIAGSGLLCLSSECAVSFHLVNSTCVFDEVPAEC